MQKMMGMVDKRFDVTGDFFTPQEGVCVVTGRNEDGTGFAHLKPQM